MLESANKKYQNIDIDELDDKLVKRIIDEKIKHIMKNIYRNRKLFELYRCGLNDREISDIINISQQYVGKIREKMRLKSNYKIIRKISDEELRKLVENGLSDAEIADKINLAKSTVHKRRTKLDLFYNSDNRKKTKSEIDKDKFRKLWSYGASDREIAKYFKIRLWDAYLMRKKLNLNSKIKNKRINKKKFTNHELIIEWYAGKNDRQIALHYNCNMAAVWRRRKKLGLPSQDKRKYENLFQSILNHKQVKNKSLGETIDIEIIEEYCNGEDFQKIAEMHNCSHDIICQILRNSCLIN